MSHEHADPTWGHASRPCCCDHVRAAFAVNVPAALHIVSMGQVPDSPMSMPTTARGGALYMNAQHFAAIGGRGG